MKCSKDGLEEVFTRKRQKNRKVADERWGDLQGDELQEGKEGTEKSPKSKGTLGEGNSAANEERAWRC